MNWRKCDHGRRAGRRAGTDAVRPASYSSFSTPSSTSWCHTDHFFHGDHSRHHWSCVCVYLSVYTCMSVSLSVCPLVYCRHCTRSVRSSSGLRSNAGTMTSFGGKLTGSSASVLSCGSVKSYTAYLQWSNCEFGAQQLIVVSGPQWFIWGPNKKSYPLVSLKVTFRYCFLAVIVRDVTRLGLGGGLKPP